MKYKIKFTRYHRLNPFTNNIELSSYVAEWNKNEIKIQDDYWQRPDEKCVNEKNQQSDHCKNFSSKRKTGG